LIDEIHEATDALGGIKDGSGNAIWKRWKKDYESFSLKKFSDLSEQDQLECKFEIIDMLHFFMNYAASIGMTPKEMYNMYMSKNEENRRRQANNY
jgi:dimeric dUTPase (all-alpha-NTP-PPase superfamily)